jgi:hypothetical protein
MLAFRVKPFGVQHVLRGKLTDIKQVDWQAHFGFARTEIENLRADG